MKWLDNTIQIDPPTKPKKCTGTRFATILGLNVWNTPFSAWCEITKTYEEPFVDTIYTKAGKAIEPKQADYMKKAYFMKNLKSPTDIFGKDYFKTTRGDFFPDHKILGGMWDFLLYDENGNPTTVLEMKTTKRSEDWLNDVPEYYALQASLYAYLLGVDNVIMVASFLEDGDYEHPENFVPSVENTITREFKVSERYPNFATLVADVEQWWETHVVGGISPQYDEKKDEKILSALRTNNLTPNTDITALIIEGEALKEKIDKVYEQVKLLLKPIESYEKRLEQIHDIIKQHSIKQFRLGDNKVSIRGNNYEWIVSRSETTTVDESKLKADGLYEKYSKPKVTYRKSIKILEEN